jgi:hypothetical protein
MPKRRVQQLIWPQNIPAPDVERFGHPPEVIPPIAVAHRIVLGINERVWLDIDMDGDFRPLIHVFELTWLNLDLSSTGGGYHVDVTKRIALSDKMEEDIDLTSGLNFPHWLNAIVIDKLDLSLVTSGNFAPHLIAQDNINLNVTEAGRYLLFETGVDSTQVDQVSSVQSLFDGEYFLPHESDAMGAVYSLVTSPYSLVVVAGPGQSDAAATTYTLATSPYDLVVVTAPVQQDFVPLNYTLAQCFYDLVVKITSQTDSGVNDATFIGGSNPVIVQATGLLIDGGANDASFIGGAVT